MEGFRLLTRALYSAQRAGDLGDYEAGAFWAVALLYEIMGEWRA